MKKVVIAQKICEEAQNILNNVAELVFVNEGNLNEFISAIKTKDAVGVVLGTWVKFTKEMMDSAPDLKIISRTGAGVDNVDVNSATERGIMVLNTPEANLISVAEHTVALIAAISKQLLFLDKELRKNNFKARRLNLPVEINGKILGLVGCGKIGRLVAKKCINAFDMKVFGYDPYLKNDIDGIKLVDNIEEIFKISDYISLHLPLTESTRNIIGDKLLSIMKPESYLINTARGGIIDERALTDKLKNKNIAGAALDVFSHEPPEDNNELLELSNVILTPHSAALTKECTVRVAIEAASGIADYLNKKLPKFIYNKEVLNKIYI